MLAAVAQCASIALLYVGSLYVWGKPGPRQDPKTVRRRMISVLGASCVSWLPLAYACASRQCTGSAQLLHLLGLRSSALLPAVLLPTALTLVLYLGPLLFWAVTPSATNSKAAGGGYGSGFGSIYTLRDLVVAPLAEEFVFRACMAPLLWLQGTSHRALVLSTPLFFGAAHLHHLRELLLLSGVGWKHALTVVAVQFTYTTVFGWFATHTFLQTGHLLSPVLVHALCNFLGLPPFGAMARSRHRTALMAATAVGIFAFAALLPWMLDARLYGDSAYNQEPASMLAIHHHL